jgi:hypothetical protein
MVWLMAEGGDVGDNVARDHRIEKLRLFVPYCNRLWMEIFGDSIVLNKPIGYVLGQDEHWHDAQQGCTAGKEE